MGIGPASSSLSLSPATIPILPCTSSLNRAASSWSYSLKGTPDAAACGSPLCFFDSNSSPSLSDSEEEDFLFLDFLLFLCFLLFEVLCLESRLRLLDLRFRPLDSLLESDSLELSELLEEDFEETEGERRDCFLLVGASSASRPKSSSLDLGSTGSTVFGCTSLAALALTASLPFLAAGGLGDLPHTFTLISISYLTRVLHSRSPSPLSFLGTSGSVGP
mmetsp:Transcript_7122/g.15575  ORF Transcript_7122/g.15575 Transcript_7122/m.15575 type:complete len:219 (+) Transcript_7122:467-1123(+)